MVLFMEERVRKLLALSVGIFVSLLVGGAYAQRNPELFFDKPAVIQIALSVGFAKDRLVLTLDDKPIYDGEFTSGIPGSATVIEVKTKVGTIHKLEITLKNYQVATLNLSVDYLNLWVVISQSLDKKLLSTLVTPFTPQFK